MTRNWRALAATMVRRGEQSAMFVLLLTFASLVLGFGLKANCLSDYPVRHPPQGCFNDIQLLWDVRFLGLHLFPYQGAVTRVSFRHGDVLNAILGPGQIEYPVVTGLFVWLTALLVSSRQAFLVVSAIALTPFALVTTRALWALAPRRVLLFAIAPALIFDGFINWDLIPAAAVACGLWAYFSRDKPALAAVLLAVGASAKLWPGFLLLPLFLHLMLDDRRREAVRVLVAAVLTTLVLNVPFIIRSPSGWLGPFIAQSARQNDYSTNSFWYFAFRGTSLSTVNTLSQLSIVIAWAVLLTVGERRRRRDGVYPWLQVGAAMVAAYIVLGRADSPQYALWLLPFLVVLQVSRRWLVIFIVTDAWLWLQWSYLQAIMNWAKPEAQVTRVVVMACMVVVLLNAPTAIRTAAGRRERPPGPGGGPASAAPLAPAPTAAPHR